MKELNLKYMGMDYWGRLVYQDINTGRFYKDETCYPYGESDGYGEYYTTSDFDGEPGYRIDKDIKVTIIKEDNNNEK